MGLESGRVVVRAELHPGDPDVVGGGGADGERPRHGGAVGRGADADRRRGRGRAWGGEAEGGWASSPGAWSSGRNCTPATPTLSEAVALTVSVPDTVAPLAGELMLTAGGVVAERGVGKLRADGPRVRARGRPGGTAPRRPRRCRRRWR